MYATYPAILDSLFPTLTTLANTDNDVQAVVTSVQALTVTLRAVPNESEGIVLEIVLELGEGPVAALVNGLLGASEVEGLHATRRGLAAHIVHKQSMHS